jgi:hypothetical protein
MQCWVLSSGIYILVYTFSTTTRSHAAGTGVTALPPRSCTRPQGVQDLRGDWRQYLAPDAYM